MGCQTLLLQEVGVNGGCFTPVIVVEADAGQPARGRRVELEREVVVLLRLLETRGQELRMRRPGWLPWEDVLPPPAMLLLLLLLLLLLVVLGRREAVSAGGGEDGGALPRVRRSGILLVLE